MADGNPQPGGQPVQWSTVAPTSSAPISTPQVEAYATLEQARAYLEAKRTLEDLTNTLRRNNASWEEVGETIKRLDPNVVKKVFGSVDEGLKQLKKGAHEFNMSWREIAAMSLPQIFKNLPGVLTSLGNILLSPVASIGALLIGLQKIDAFLAQLNRNTAMFAVATGAGATGQLRAVMGAMRPQIEQARIEMTNMGIGREQQSKLFGMMATALPQSVQRQAGPAWAAVAGAFTKTFQLSEEKAVEMTSSFVKSGISAEEMSNARDRLAAGLHDLPLPGAAEGLNLLWSRSRFLGASFQQTGDLAIRWGKDISRGLMTWNEALQSMKGAADYDINQLVRASVMGAQSGSPQWRAIVGQGSPLQMAERLFQELTTKGGQARVQQAAQQAVQMGGPGMLGALPPGGLRQAMFGQVSGLFQFMPAESARARAVGIHVQALGDRAEGAGKILDTFRTQIGNARDVTDDTSTTVERFGRRLSAATDQVAAFIRGLLSGTPDRTPSSYLGSRTKRAIPFEHRLIEEAF